MQKIIALDPFEHYFKEFRELQVVSLCLGDDKLILDPSITSKLSWFPFDLFDILLLFVCRRICHWFDKTENWKYK